MYGRELILDLHGCDVTKFNRVDMRIFLGALCDEIGMEACDLHFWDDEGVPEDECQTSPKTKGTSVVMFIITSSIVVHALDLMGTVFINIFSCKEFDDNSAQQFCSMFFRARCCRRTVVERTDR